MELYDIIHGYDVLFLKLGFWSFYLSFGFYIVLIKCDSQMKTMRRFRIALCEKIQARKNKTVIPKQYISIYLRIRGGKNGYSIDSEYTAVGVEPL